MEIKRSNYEAWFIDLLDGNLNSSQVEQLELFLSENPDLREELNDLNLFKLDPSDNSYKKKANLKKSSSEIPQDQFEYLCAAYFENDISAGQKNELMELISADSEKKKSFDLFQNLRLVPEKISYEYKNLLLRKTPLQKVIRISAIGLSAAVLTLIITIYLNIQRNQFSVIKSTAETIADSTIHELPQKMLPVTGKEARGKQNLVLITAGPNGLSATKNEIMEVGVRKVPVPPLTEIKDHMIPSSLVAARGTDFHSQAEYEGSKIGRFVSKTFREKLLKEKTPAESPLNGFEVAEAGIMGINKLLGWQIALGKKSDEKGQVKSVYFSSRLLKINAPVKKSEPLQ
jgi:hypothetical protein